MSIGEQEICPWCNSKITDEGGCRGRRPCSHRSAYMDGYDEGERVAGERIKALRFTLSRIILRAQEHRGTGLIETWAREALDADAAAEKGGG